MPFDEIVLSDTATAAAISRAVAGRRMRKIGPALYTPNMADAAEAIIRRNLWQVVSLYCPGAIITDRTGIENRPASDGSVFVIHDRTTDVILPGLRIRPRSGPAALEEDRRFIGSLRLAAPGRALLENLKPSRARSGVARTLKRSELETHLEKILATRGADALNRLRDEARRMAPLLGLDREMEQLDRMIGALLGTRNDPTLSAPAAMARVSGSPYDQRRLALFETLRVELATQAPLVRPPPALTQAGHDNLAFFEAYFSNFIEGTEFEVEEAFDIVFRQAIPAARPEDAHDVLGTFRVVANRTEMARVPDRFDGFMALLKDRHRAIMELRPEKRPGQFKQTRNRVGEYWFVDPDLVPGTLAKGWEMCRSLPGAFERAAFMMFVVAEVHPFEDGNGRTARIMMNAELVAAGEQRIIIPTVYRENYLSALRALSNGTGVEPFFRMLDFAQDYTRRVPWNSFDQARHVLTATRAFMRSQDAEEQGLRLRKPTPDQLQAAEDADADGGMR